MNIDDYLFEIEEEMKSEFCEPGDDVEDEEADDEDRCNCSDPTCPCGGFKRGSHHNI